ncbi:hypothetical protein QL285_025788 [Trifolium repens]|nr:hypothetical protein QL285_025788 [Trifolium repens]
MTHCCLCSYLKDSSIHHGMKRSDASFLILEEAAADYHLPGPLGEFLSMVAELKCLPILELIGDLTLDSVLKFEKELVTSGWNVFLSNFGNLILHDSFSKFRDKQIK